MSKYTTELRFICETYAGLSESVGENSIENVITNSLGKLFDFNFPIFDESYRAVLERKIVMHYYTREIGLETFGLWKLKLETKLNEIMPYYNELYESTTFKYNPLYDADYYKTTKGTDVGENNRAGQSNTVNNSTNNTAYDESGENSGKNKRVNKFSDTPQGGLIGIEDDNYLTNVTIEENEGENSYSKNGHNLNTVNGSVVGTDSETGNFNTTKDYIDHVFGKFPGRSYAKDIREYRENLLNIDMQIIDELKDLFMLLW